MVAIKPIANNPIVGLMDKIFKNHKPFYCQKISDSFYRGSQPNAEQMKGLAQKGIKTILNLRTVSASELEELSKEAEAHGINYINIPLNPFKIKKSFPFIMETINSASKENPLFIHCTYGKDRTGFVSALVNYIKNGMSMKDAIKDMTDHGSTNPIFINLKRFLLEFDHKCKNFTNKMN